MTNPSTDVFALLDAVNAAGVATGGELAITGFDTQFDFDVNWMREVIGRNEHLVLEGSANSYTISLVPNTLTDTSVRGTVMEIGEEVLPPHSRHMVTIIRTPDGCMRVVPGWN